MVKFGFVQFDPSSPFDSLDSILGVLAGAGCVGSESVSWAGGSWVAVVSGALSGGSAVGCSTWVSGAEFCSCCWLFAGEVAAGCGAVLGLSS